MLSFLPTTIFRVRSNLNTRCEWPGEPGRTTTIKVIPTTTRNHRFSPSSSDDIQKWNAIMGRKIVLASKPPRCHSGRYRCSRQSWHGTTWRILSHARKDTRCSWYGSCHFVCDPVRIMRWHRRDWYCANYSAETFILSFQILYHTHQLQNSWYVGVFLSLPKSIIRSVHSILGLAGASLQSAECAHHFKHVMFPLGGGDSIHRSIWNYCLPSILPLSQWWGARIYSSS